MRFQFFIHSLETTVLNAYPHFVIGGQTENLKCSISIRFLQFLPASKFYSYSRTGNRFFVFVINHNTRNQLFIRRDRFFGRLRWLWRFGCDVPFVYESFRIGEINNSEKTLALKKARPAPDNLLKKYPRSNRTHKDDVLNVWNVHSC